MASTSVANFIVHMKGRDGSRVSRSKTSATIARLKRPGGVKGVRIGFFENARYPDGQPVARVAVWNEYGTPRTARSPGAPARPFMRKAVDESKGKVSKLMEGVDGEKLELSPRRAEMVGLVVEDAIKRSINDLRTPPNSPVTVALKKSSNPLVDTGQMKLSVTHRVEY